MSKRIKQALSPYPLIRIHAFGEFIVERLLISSPSSVSEPQYVRVPWDEWANRGSALTLLKILLCSPRRRASKEALIHAIWPDHQLIDSSHAFDSAVSILRRHILSVPDTHGYSLLATLRVAGETSFQLPDQPQLWLDADAFLELASQAFCLEQQGQDPQLLLEQAHVLAQGEFLEDNLLHAWSRGRRITITGARHRVLYQLAELYQRNGRVHHAEELLFAFLEEYPTDDDALYHLLLLLGRGERRQEALQIYSYITDMLHAEQREPTPPTRELAQRIRHGIAIREPREGYVTTPGTSIWPATFSAATSLSASYVKSGRRSRRHLVHA